MTKLFLFSLLCMWCVVSMASAQTMTVEERHQLECYQDPSWTDAGRRWRLMKCDDTLPQRQQRLERYLWEDNHPHSVPQMKAFVLVAVLNGARTEVGNFESYDRCSTAAKDYTNAHCEWGTYLRFRYYGPFGRQGTPLQFVE